MRLLDVDKYNFVNIPDPQRLRNTVRRQERITVERYAILSHTWDDGQELSYQDWQLWARKDPGFEILESRSGFEKVMATCRKAKDMGYHRVWIDTICIDKSSSAELSEAINSMFAFYSNAAVCLAFLSDINEEQGAEAMENSRWFTRGWTLQELLAPAQIEFFGRTWQPLGSKRELMTIISKTTGIPDMHLHFPHFIYAATIADRMSWAAGRQTTRIEDISYCLLGIFDINMPLLYGEADKAFVRLQEEILKVSMDHSIFAWSWQSIHLVGTTIPWVTLLAPDIQCFAGTGSKYEALGQSAQEDVNTDVHTMTNVGLQIRLPLIHTSSNRSYAVLKLFRMGWGRNWGRDIVCIPISRHSGRYLRCGWPENPVSFPKAVLDSQLKYSGTIFFARQASIYLPERLSTLVNNQHTVRDVKQVWRWFDKENCDYLISNPGTTDMAPEQALQILFHGPETDKLEWIAGTTRSKFKDKFSVLEIFDLENCVTPLRRTQGKLFPDSIFRGALFHLHTKASYLVQVLVGIGQGASGSNPVDVLQLSIHNTNRSNVAEHELSGLVEELQSDRPNVHRVQWLFSRMSTGREHIVGEDLHRNESGRILKHVKYLTWHAAIGASNDELVYKSDLSPDRAIKPCPVFIWEESE